MAVVAGLRRCRRGARLAAARIFIIGVFCTLTVNTQDTLPELVISEEHSAADEEIPLTVTEASHDLYQNLEHNITNGVDVEIIWDTPNDLIDRFNYKVECEEVETGRQVSQTILGGKFTTYVVLSLDKPLAAFDCVLLAISTESGRALNGSSVKFTVTTGDIAQPSHVRLFERTSTSLTFTWTSDTTSNKWKVITNRIGESDAGRIGAEEDGEGEDIIAKHKVTNLEPSTQYNISIQNCRGIYCSKPTFVTGVTDAAPPGPVKYLNYKIINGTNLEVAWEAPEGSKKVDGYFITCEGISSCVDVTKQVESVGPSILLVLSLEEPKEIFECAVQAFRTDATGRPLNGTTTRFEVSTDGLYAPENLKVLERSDRSLFVSWAPDVNTTMWKMIAWRVLPLGDDYGSIQEHGKSSGKTMKYNLTNLTPWTRYKVSLQNCMENFCSEPAMLLASTAPAAPSRVRNFAGTVEREVNAHFTWERPEHPNGPLDGYQLLVHNEDRQETTSLTVPGNFTQIRLNLAYEFSRFNVSIAAYNMEESSNATMYSPVTDVIFQSLGNGPAPPRVEVADKTDSSVRLSWEVPPDPRYHIVQFKVKFNESHTITTDGHLNISDLDAWKHYNLSVASCINDTTCGQETMVEFETEFGEPSIPLNLTINSMGSQWMLIKWEQPKISNGPLSGYNVVVSDGITEFHVTTTDLSYNYTDVVPGCLYDVKVYAFNSVDGIVKNGPVASANAPSPESDSLNKAGVSKTRALIGGLAGLVLVLLIMAYVLHKKCPLTGGPEEAKIVDAPRKPRRMLLDDL